VQHKAVSYSDQSSSGLERARQRAVAKCAGIAEALPACSDADAFLLINGGAGHAPRAAAVAIGCDAGSAVAASGAAGG
jgi:hypothetical protein